MRPAAGRGSYEIADQEVGASIELADQRIRRLEPPTADDALHILYALIHAAGTISRLVRYDCYDAVADEAYVDSTVT